MFDDSAAVPAAYEYEEVPNEAQPLGPYSCTIAEAGKPFIAVFTAGQVLCETCETFNM